MINNDPEYLLNAAQIIDDYIRDEFVKQGHSLTEQWEKSVIHKEISHNEIEGLALGYGFIVDKGILPERIPYGGSGSGHSGTSKYISALVNYWKQRKPGIGDKEALKLAFKTAEVQKREGMSTIASEEFSANAKRQHFLDSMKILFEDYLDNWIFEGMYWEVNLKAKEPKLMYL